MSFIDALTEAFTSSLYKREYKNLERIEYPKPLFTKATLDAEVRLREIALKEKELEIRRLEALAKLETARRQEGSDEPS